VREIRGMTALPPRVPTELAELDALIMLLGNRTKGELRTKARHHLTELCGVYPTAATAQLWKNELKQIRKELAQELANAVKDTDAGAGEAAPSSGPDNPD
jgi:hypothetical protein